MESGIFTTPYAESTVTVTLDTSIVKLATWGNVQARQVGSLVFIRFYGIQSLNDIDGAVTIATLNVVPKVNAVYPAWTVNRTLNGEFITDRGSAYIKANHMVKGVNSYVEVIFPA